MPDRRRSPNFNRNPMFWLAAAFAVGILAANISQIELSVSVIAAGIFAILAVLLRTQTIATYLVFIAFALAGAASIQIEKQNITPDRIRVLYDTGAIRSGDPVEVEGVLTARPEPSVDGVFLNLRAEKLKHRGVEQTVSGNVRLFLPQVDANDEANLRSEISNLSSEMSDLKSEISDLRYGSRLRIACKLSREDQFLNPGVISKKEILDRLGVDATGSVKSRLLIEKIADESVFIPLAWIYDQRAAMIESFRRNLSPQAAGVMIASLLGDKHFLDKETADLFRNGGTFHILVISGLHITFIGGLLLLFLRQITRNRWTQFIVTTSILWAYTLAVGADVPVVRAAIMFTLLSFSHVIYRGGSLVNSLGGCALILLVWRPSDLFNPSFQLTFVSVAAIIALAYPLTDHLRQIGKWTPRLGKPFPPNVPTGLRRFCEMIYWDNNAWAYESKRQIWSARLFKFPYLSNRLTNGFHGIVRYAFEGILVSAIVQITLLPLMVVYFHRVSWISILLNLWIGIFIALESFAAVIAVFAGKISTFLGAGFFFLAEIFNWIMLSVPWLFSDVNSLSFRLSAYSGYGRIIYLLFVFPIIFFAFALSCWKPFELKGGSWPTRARVIYPAAAMLTALIFITALHPFSTPRPDGRLHIDFLDVGQGDAALITFPDGRTLLVDGGGRIRYERGDEDEEDFEADNRGIGEAVVSEFLWHRGYSQIDHILGTHADTDHIDGLQDVVKNFEVGSALFARTPINDKDFSQLTSILARRNIPIETITRGDRLKFGDATVEVLFPSAFAENTSDNDNSIVIRITYGARSFLLTGDIEMDAEYALATSGGTLAADVVKVAHHGSRTSSTAEFINATGAGLAVISVGRSSPFGHPHAEVVDRWRASGAKVMTTGERGTISVSTDGSNLKVESFQR